MQRLFACLLAFGGSLPFAALADEPTPPVAPPPQGCPDDAYRGFDFWLGEWVVTGRKQQPVGHSRVTKVMQGCAVLEEWFGFAYRGMSLNTYDPATQLWRQSWVDANGTVLNLLGAAAPDRMVLRGESTGEGGAKVRHEIEWTRLGADAVRQVWRQAKGDGAYEVVFDGRYERSATRLDLASQCSADAK